MKKLIKSQLLIQIVVASVVATLATAGIVGAATTIGSNINTGGTLDVTGATTIYGATSIGGALTATSTLAVSKNITVPTGYGLDTAAAAGTLNIGTTTATIINIGSTDATTAVKGLFKVPAAYGLDVFSTGVLNIGTSTANAITIGSSGITTTNAGALTVTGATTLSSTLALTGLATLSNNITVPNGYGLDAVSGTLNIGTTTATSINLSSTNRTVNILGPLAVTGTSTLSNNITVPNGYGLDTAAAGVLNLGTTTATSINIGKAGVPAVIANASSTLANFGSGTTVAKLLFGTCTVDFGTSLGAGTATTTNCAATGVDNTYKVFVTPSTLETYLAFNSASSTNNAIQVQVFNTSTSTPLTIAARTWSWMAIK